MDNHVAEMNMAADLARLWEKSKAAGIATWSRTTRRMRVAGSFVLLSLIIIYLSLPSIRTVDAPRLHLEYTAPPLSPYNATKVALLIENRAVASLAPLMLHFMAVIPPDWRFRFMGSTESVAFLNQSVAIREQVSAGKLDLTYIPSNMSTAGQEMISRFLTNLWLYETVLQPAEWLLVFQTDSILCANSRQNLNDYLDYDWVGAPWNPQGRFGGNGGLSLRKVSAIVEILRDQVRVDGSEPEDVWLTERLGHRPHAKMANGSLSLTFSGEMYQGEQEAVKHADGADGGGEAGGGGLGKVVLRPGLYNSSDLEAAAQPGQYVKGIDDWRDGFYEPMGYHTGGSGTMLHGGIWGRPELRKHIWDYCPEVKMTLNMDAAAYVPGECNFAWKRGEPDGGGGGGGAVEDLGYGTEVIDGVAYPALPPNLVPW
ncbi:Uu.00g081540.m01.CDS01 [Anthostomella pinea]|uniref:Uu.00g081540.m01.CDS01 n=1 Tax=Anthostomella pinea TaxID=933095 RepID=A0AAI8VFT9_9PEZI|nr:Uu.00g081540.m01.CDS01 [Anthostomella pinea]